VNINNEFSSLKDNIHTLIPKKENTVETSSTQKDEVDSIIKKFSEIIKKLGTEIKQSAHKVQDFFVVLGKSRCSCLTKAIGTFEKVNDEIIKYEGELKSLKKQYPLLTNEITKIENELSTLKSNVKALKLNIENKKTNLTTPSNPDCINSQEAKDIVIETNMIYSLK
jgi:chromosome segregation ATPase